FSPVECDRTRSRDDDDARLTRQGCFESDPGIGLYEEIFQRKFLLESGRKHRVDELGSIHSPAGAGNTENDILQSLRRASILLSAFCYAFEENVCRTLDPGDLSMARTGVTVRDDGTVQSDDQSIGLGPAAIDSYHITDLFRHHLPLRAKVVGNSRNASQIIEKRFEKQGRCEPGDESLRSPIRRPLIRPGLSACLLFKKDARRRGKETSSSLSRRS